MYVCIHLSAKSIAEHAFHVYLRFYSKLTGVSLLYARLSQKKAQVRRKVMARMRARVDVELPRLEQFAYG